MENPQHHPNTYMVAPYINYLVMETKQCSRCKKVKSKYDFSLRQKANDGLSWACKECLNQCRKERRRSLLKRGICYSCGGKLDALPKKICSKCRAKQREYRQKNRLKVTGYTRNKKQFYVEHLGGKCIRCGYKGTALDFHHLTNEKDNVMWTASKNLVQLIDEGKIMLLCSNCHRERHYSFHWWYRIFEK